MECIFAKNVSKAGNIAAWRPHKFINNNKKVDHVMPLQLLVKKATENDYTHKLRAIKTCFNKVFESVNVHNSFGNCICLEIVRKKKKKNNAAERGECQNDESSISRVTLLYKWVLVPTSFASFLSFSAGTGAVSVTGCDGENWKHNNRFSEDGTHSAFLGELGYLIRLSSLFFQLFRAACAPWVLWVSLLLKWSDG